MNETPRKLNEELKIRFESYRKRKNEQEAERKIPNENPWQRGVEAMTSLVPSASTGAFEEVQHSRGQLAH